MSLAAHILGLLHANASSGSGAFKITEAVFTELPTALRRDPRFAGISDFELTLLLRDVRNRLEQVLFREMRDRIHIEDAEDAIRRCLGGE
jgi:hypothetical protein